MNMSQSQKALICVSIGQKSIKKALAVALNVEPVADVIEIRLDTLTTPEIISFTKALDKPLLFTHRPVWEGGLYAGGEAERIDLLSDAITHGAAFIDLELRASEESFARIKAALAGRNTRLVVSNHNFESTPSREDLLTVLREMKKRRADIGKIVTTAHDYLDVLNVLQLQKDAAELDLPLIAFCMGRAGVISRFATVELAGFMTYCAPSEQEATAPGQISVQVMRDMMKSLSAG
jgi:3-dehydroquinate dehydratase-1/3-dehydroquinate dehydratase/shikimate dehydrogenase